MKESNTLETLTRDEFCKFMNFSLSTFYRLMKEGKLPKYLKIKRKIAIVKSDIEEWISKNKI